MRTAVAWCWRVAVSLFIAQACAEAQQYSFRYYGIEQGLDNLSAQVLLQDRTGFLWVGTQNGLYRYQGQSFVQFGEKEGLPPDYVDCLHESPNGVLWVGTPQGLFRFTNGRFVATQLAGTKIESVASSAQGELLVAAGSGLWAGDWRNPEAPGFHLVDLQGKVRAGDSFISADQSVWVGCDEGVCQLSGGKLKAFGSNEGLEPGTWRGFAQDRRGDLWVRSDTTLAVLRTGRTSFETVPAPWPIESASRHRMSVDRSGRLFIPTLGGAVVRQEDGRWLILGTVEGLLPQEVTQVLEDREG